MASFSEKLSGALYGVAIGDGMGAPVEMWPSERILDRFPDHDFTAFLPTTHAGDPTTGKGNGRITDDTLMTEALIRAYGKCRDHMDAYSFREFMVPEFAQTVVWVPERKASIVLLDRLNPIEKYTVARLVSFQAYPRHAGIGNAINCGVAMYIMPVGPVNAGDPRRAFDEAAALAMAETDSYGVEAAGVLAAGYAHAFSRDAGIEDVCSAALAAARDGTRQALAAVLSVSAPEDSLEDFIGKTRAAFQEFDPTGSSVHQPSRALSIEEVPIALAALKYGNGDFARTIRAAVCYGHDCDSIGGMACGLYGAIFGCDAIPESLAKASDAVNQRDFGAIASAFEETIRAIYRSDAGIFQRRRSALGESPVG